VRHSGGRGDLPVRASHEFGSRQQGKQDLEAGGLKSTAAFEGQSLVGTALALDEDQDRRLIQERVARRVDELDSLDPQGVGQRRRHVVCHKKGNAAVGSQLMDDGPKRSRAQAALHLGDVAESTPAEPETDRGVRAMVTAPRFRPQNLELQAERLHRLDRVGKKALLGVLSFVHQKSLSTRRGQMSIVDSRASGFRCDAFRNRPKAARRVRQVRHTEPVMSRDLSLLERHFRHWREEGLLSAELESSLRESSGQLVNRATSTVVRTALGGLGGGLLLAGLILVVAENWEALHRSLKLGGWALLQLAFLLCAHQLGRARPGRPALAEAMSFVSGGWMLAGIALVSQIYQLDSRPPNGIWLWLALVLPAAWLLERRAVAAVVFIALVWGFALETGQIDSIFRADRGDGPWIWIGIPLLAAGLASFLPTSARFLREWTGLWTFVAGNVFLLVLGASQDLDRSDLGRGWWLAGAGVLLGIAIPDQCLSRAWDSLTSRLVVASTFLPWILLGSRYDAGLILDELAVGLAWIVQLVIAILAIRAGARRGSESWVNLGYLALLAGILTRYFDFFGDYLEGGIALALTGTLLLFILYTLEKARRRTVRGAVPA